MQAAVFGLIAAGYILAIFSTDGTGIENKRIETAEQSAAEEQIQAEITFREELIEEAVRKELGLSKTDKITASMLENVRKLRIIGKEILDDEDTFWVKATMWMERTAASDLCAEILQIFRIWHKW